MHLHSPYLSTYWLNNIRQMERYHIADFSKKKREIESNDLFPHFNMQLASPQQFRLPRNNSTIRPNLVHLSIKLRDTCTVEKETIHGSILEFICKTPESQTQNRKNKTRPTNTQTDQTKNHFGIFFLPKRLPLPFPPQTPSKCKTKGVFSPASSFGWS